jgi:hypothetical protein
MKTTRPTAPATPAPRRRLRKALVFAFLGVLLGVLAVLFLAWVHNPFEEGIGDRQLLHLAPPDADMLVFIPRVPQFLGELRDRPFSRVLAEHQGFQQFLRSEFARGTGAVEALSAAFREVDMLRSRPPLGLDLWKDISGDALVFAGYAPSAPGEPWQFIAMFRPNSWKVLAAVNVLVNDVLGNLPPIKNGLEAAGVTKVDRYRDSVSLTFARGPSLALARIRNVVVVGTQADRISRLKTTIERDRLPASPPSRYADLAQGVGGSPYEARAVVRRKVADAQLGLTQQLNNNWGADNVSLLEAALPRFGGDDVLVTLAVDEALDVKARMLEGAARMHDLARSYRPSERDEAGIALMRAAPLLPASTFAFCHLKVDVIQFLDAFFQRSELFNPSDISNLADGLRSLPELNDLNGLKEKLARVCDGKTSVGFFKEDREGLDKPTPGYFVAFHLQDEKELKRVLDAIGTRLRDPAPNGRKALRDLVHVAKGEVDYYEIVVPDGVVDDARVTKLGLVVGREVLIVTNYIPSFRELTQVATIQDRVLPAERTLVSAIERGPDSTRVACAIAGDSIYEWFDQAAPGWAVQRTTPSGKQEYEWRITGAVKARGAGLREGTTEFEKFVEDDYQGRVDELVKIRRPTERRTIDRYLGEFRGLVRSVGFFIGEKDGVELSLRIALNGTAE